MDYVSKIFERTNITGIRTYLMYGAEASKNEDEKTFYERLKESDDNAKPSVEELIPDKEQRLKVENAFVDSVGATNDIYMEIGMKCGAMIMYQLLK